MSSPSPAALSYAPAWTRDGRAEWLDDGVRLRCRPDPAAARFELLGLLIATAAALTVAGVILTKTWSGPAAAGGPGGIRLALTALALPLLVLGAFGARAAYRHHRHGPPEDVFDRATRTFRSGFANAKPLPFDDVSHVALRQPTGILYVLEVHSRHARKPALTRLRLTQPAAGTLAGLAAGVIGVPFTPPGR